MERKIGEIFEFNDEWYQCIENENCSLCSFYELNCKKVETCIKDLRTDKKNVIYKKLEKVGEPFIINGKKYQRYITHVHPYILNELNSRPIDDSIVLIEVKQNKEDMKKEKYSNSENIGKNLKPFDLEAAKAGKPVCTRSGKPVRIICFDVKGSTHPIIALIEEGEDERLCSYMPNGRRYEDEEEWKDDLMMLPEKKEGWVNVCKNLNTGRYELDDEEIYDTKEEALQNLSSMTYVATVKIEWEE